MLDGTDRAAERKMQGRTKQGRRSEGGLSLPLPLLSSPFCNPCRSVPIRRSRARARVNAMALRGLASLPPRRLVDRRERSEPEARSGAERARRPRRGAPNLGDSGSAADPRGGVARGFSPPGCWGRRSPPLAVGPIRVPSAGSHRPRCPGEHLSGLERSERPSVVSVEPDREGALQPPSPSRRRTEGYSASLPLRHGSVWPAGLRQSARGRLLVARVRAGSGSGRGRGRCVVVGGFPDNRRAREGTTSGQCWPCAEA